MRLRTPACNGAPGAAATGALAAATPPAFTSDYALTVVMAANGYPSTPEKGGAIHGIPSVMDGFISGVAALCAARLCPNAGKAAFASHASSEPAARLVLEALGKQPLITADMHLGEGTGAVASIPLWDMALAVYQNCYSFAEGGIEPYTPQC